MSGKPPTTGTSNPVSRTDDLFPCVVHGAVDEIDATRGCLRAGQQADPSLVLVSLLDELRVDAAVLECSLLPSGDQYEIVLHAPQEGGQAVLVPRLVLERALVDPLARARMRDLLRGTTHALAKPAGKRRRPAHRILRATERPVVAGTPLRARVTTSSDVRDVPPG